MANRSSSQRARSFASLRLSPWMRAASTRFSRPVAIGSEDGRCETSPILRRTASGSAATSAPATEAVPESARDSVDSTLTVVDLPAPFGPSSP
jgi:hypothetical protein